MAAKEDEGFEEELPVHSDPLSLVSTNDSCRGMKERMVLTKDWKCVCVGYSEK
jgi:hypothetical protein